MKTIVIKISAEELLQNEGENIVIVLDNTTKGFEKKEVENKPNDKSVGYFEFMETVIGELQSAKKERTAEAYRAAYSCLQKWRNGKEFSIDELTAQMAQEYETWLRQKGLTINTGSFYMRTIKAVYNRAVERGIVKDVKPFAKVFTGNARTVKRALDMKTINEIANAEMESERQCFARDMFLFSFYTRGMSFVDMAYLKKTDIKDGILEYQRKKTGQKLSIRWEGIMQHIVDCHPTENSIYLLPIIKKCNGRERGQYRSSQRHINEDLHEIGKKIGVSKPLTMYVARHSWATIAREMDTPMSVISQGMGHDSERTTQIYLKEIDNGKIDKANSRIIAQIGSLDNKNASKSQLTNTAN